MFDYAQKIMESPDAPIQIEALHQAMQTEQSRRHDFREWITPNVKAEFINGEVVLHSPVKKQHWSVTDLLSRVLSIYSSVKQLGRVGTEKVMIALTRNDYEPDVCFFGKEKADLFSPTQMQFPAPDIAVEVLSPSTEKYDRETKYQDYAAHGIREYWIIDAEHEIIEQYFLQNEEYELLLKAKDGTIQSIVLPDFKIQIRALFDEKLNLEELKRLI